MALKKWTDQEIIIDLLTKIANKTYQVNEPISIFNLIDTYQLSEVQAKFFLNKIADSFLLKITKNGDYLVRQLTIAEIEDIFLIRASIVDMKYTRLIKALTSKNKKEYYEILAEVQSWDPNNLYQIIEIETKMFYFLNRVVPCDLINNIFGEEALLSLFLRIYSLINIPDQPHKIKNFYLKIANYLINNKIKNLHHFIYEALKNDQDTFIRVYLNN
ncbi:hypothetical protein P344_02050 [Spiroplasma mirum ATCC 29335]|uniref:Uncharacterized protein n=1 Tax=Spiroplasma mirum ATCC 29335 TaxID=838561 RepID=W0GQH7_9MOLU|nr:MULTISPECIES: hypothetical protein [Spiroplasma]AHF60796.1 hypothetical protein SMM_0345 [Spiroplasma mirum ATCC 29335]AHI57758.1 hypothetical protein P344_02050 [Spiroplasma mirum ATCC 29335]AKM52909.1 hypothetical protein SATRI_v1c03900 [Spiroplasma atrichopogonis]